MSKPDFISAFPGLSIPYDEGYSVAKSDLPDDNPYIEGDNMWAKSGWVLGWMRGALELLGIER